MINNDHNNEQVEIGKRYFMRDPSVPSSGGPNFYLYTGLQDGANGKEHEFVFTPTYMTIPSGDSLLTRRFPEDGLFFAYAGSFVLIDLGSSQMKQVYVEPNTEDHKRLNNILVDYDKRAKAKYR